MLYLVSRFLNCLHVQVLGGVEGRVGLDSISVQEPRGGMTFLVSPVFSAVLFVLFVLCFFFLLNKGSCAVLSKRTPLSCST